MFFSLQNVGCGQFQQDQLGATAVSTGYSAIIWCREGDVDVVIEDDQYKLAAGQICVVFPDMEFTFTCCSPTCSLCWFVVEGHDVENTCRTQGLWSGVFNGGPISQEWFEALNAKWREKKADVTQCAAIAYDAVDYVSTVIQTSAMEPIMHQAKRLMHIHYGDQQYTINSLFRELKIHRTELDRMFREAGNTALQYLQDVRIRESRRQLRITDRHVADIAKSCGYDDQNYFARLFRKHMKCSPTIFRNKCRCLENQPRVKKPFFQRG